MNNNHDIIVKVGLTADQYVAFHTSAKNDDLKDAQLLRSLILKHIREVAMSELSANHHDLESAELVLTTTNHSEPTALELAREINKGRRLYD